jgi:hypothetical protein
MLGFPLAPPRASHSCHLKLNFRRPYILHSSSSMVQCDRLTGSPGTSQKEGQEDQGKEEELGGTCCSCFAILWFFWLSFWFFPGLPGAPPNDL